MLEFTKEEKRILVFLVISALVGCGVLFLRKQRGLRKHNPGRFEAVEAKRLDAIIRERKIVNINTADIERFERLPGIGPALAQRIISYRDANGNFAAIEDIKNVKGISDKKFEVMKERLVVW